METRAHLFRHALGNLQYGVTEERLDQQLLDCINAAKETNKQAVLTLKIAIQPENNGAQMQLTADISAKMPKLASPKTLFFSTDNDPLTRYDPKQLEIPDMRVVAKEERPIEFKQAKG